MTDKTRVFDDNLSTVFFIAIVYPLGPAAIILMPMLVGGVIDSYSFSEHQAGYIAALEGMGLVVSSLLAALWVRKVSWVRALFIFFIANAIINAVSANCTDFMSLLVARFFAGMTGGSIFAITVTALGDNSHPDRAFGIAQVVQGVMMFAAFAVAPYILEQWDVSGLYYMLATVSVLMVLALKYYPVAGADRSITGSSTVGQESYRGYIWLALLASFLFFSNLFGFWTFVERIGQSAGLSTETIGLALGFAQLGMIAGAVGVAVASDRFGRTLPMIITLLGMLVVLWVLAGQFSLISFYLGVALFQAVFVIGNCYQMGVIAKIDVKGKYLVLVTGFQGLGAAVGPAIAASLISEGDYSKVNIMAALLCVISILIFLFIIYRTRQIRSSVRVPLKVISIK